MECPGCHADLEVEQYRGLTVDVCPLCGSVWFDTGELELYRRHWEGPKLLKLGRAVEFRPKIDLSRECPRCNTLTLDMGVIGHYEAGQCFTCKGLWVSQERPEKPLTRDGSLEELLDWLHWASLLS